MAGASSRGGAEAQHEAEKYGDQPARGGSPNAAQSSCGSDDTSESADSLCDELDAMECPPPDVLDMLAAVQRGDEPQVLEWLTAADRSQAALGYGRLAARAAAREGNPALATQIVAALSSWPPPGAG